MAAKKRRAKKTTKKTRKAPKRSKRAVKRGPSSKRTAPKVIVQILSGESSGTSVQRILRGKR
jgi:hypothetical protein